MGGGGGYKSSDPLTSCYSATLEANFWPGYNSQLDILIINLTHPHLPSLEPLLKVLLSIGMEVFIPVPWPTPPSCCRIEEDNPTPTACLALKQVTWGRVVITPHQPHCVG